MSKITEQFVPYKQAKELKELGFEELCFGFYQNDESLAIGLEEKDIQHFTNKRALESETYQCIAPLYQQAFDWFREKHDLDIIFQLIYYSNHTKKGYFLTIFEGTNHRDLLNYEEAYNDILEDSGQEVEGNYLNDELHDTLIFERKFAYKTYQEAQLACLHKLIELVKNNKV